MTKTISSLFLVIFFRQRLRHSLLPASLGLLALLLVGSSARSQSRQAGEAETEARIDLLLPKLSLDERLNLIGGVDSMFIRAVPAIGLPKLKTSDGPLGIRTWGPAIDYAGGIALAATFDAAMAHELGVSIARDARARGVHVMLAPAVNIYRAPMNSRDFGLYDAAPVPEWQRPSDPRSKIRIADLLRMSGGLHFTAPRDPDFSPDVFPDHVYVYNGAVNIYEFAYARPLQFQPNTEGRYRNCDPLTLAFILQQAVAKRGEEYFSFPQRRLLDRIGIRKMVLETDPYGNMFFTGNNYATARDWARLGLLYLQGGTWQGERILPEGFVEFVRTPAPAWKQPVYGGLLWLNTTGQWNLPTDAYYMSGGGGKVCRGSKRLTVLLIATARAKLLRVASHKWRCTPNTEA